MAGTTFTWTATTSTAWTVGTNWSPDGPPTAADTAIVPSASIRINSGTVAITDLSLGGSLIGPTPGQGAVSVVTGGELLVSDALAVWGGSTLSVDAASFVDIGTSGSAPAGSILVENGHSLLGDGMIVGSLVNNGTIDSTNNGTLTSSTGGELTIHGAVSGVGTMNIEPGAALQLEGSIAAGETIDFVGGGAPDTLILNAPGTVFNDAITGLDTGDRIEFGNGMTITSASMVNGNTIAVSFHGSARLPGTYDLTDAAFAPGSGTQFSWGTDSSTGDSYVQVQPLSSQTVVVTTKFLFLDGAAGLWSVDEATGAATELETLPGVAATNDFWAGNGKAWFTAIATGSVSERGTQLWASTGTAQGTSLIVALPDNNNSLSEISDVVFLSNGKAIFSYDDGSGNNSLYLTDGTGQGTAEVTGISGSVVLPISSLATEISGAFVFLSSNGFWSLNETTGAPTLVQALNVGGDFFANPGVVVANGQAFFSATAPGSNSTAGTQLWVSNGTAHGTSLVTTLPDNTPPTSSYDSAGIYGMVALSNGKVLFSYDDGSGTRSLYWSDGTSQGTVQVSGYSGTANLSAFSGDPASELGGNYLFVDGTGLWSVNETTGAATKLVSLNGAVYQPTMIVADGEVWFQAIAPGSPSDFGTQLWVSNGTPQGTELVTTLPDTPASDSDPSDAGIRNISALANGNVAISYVDGNNNGSLYESDGTAQGTTLVVGFSSGGQYPEQYPELPFGAAAEFNTVTLTPQSGQTVSLDQLLVNNPTIASAGTIQSLLLDGPGTVSVSGAVSIHTLEISDGQLLLSSGTVSTDLVTVDAQGDISGYGTVSGVLTNLGTITANGGTLELTGSVGGTGTLEATDGATLALDLGAITVSGLVSVAASSALDLTGELTVNGTLANFGAVSGGPATEVAFGSGNDRLILGPAATFGGTVAGGGINSTIELAAGTGAGTLTGLGTNFTNFGTVIVDPGATWTVDAAVSLLATTTFIGNGALSTLALTGAGTFSLANVSNFGTIDLAAGNNTVTLTDKTLSGGAVTINDGASGNDNVSAASDTSASKGKSLTYNTGSGTDTFTGGFENDTVNVSAAAVAGDTLTGGSGTNTLVLTSAGNLNLAGVSKFSTIDLAAGNSTVTVTDALLSGGSLTINDGASGNNTVSAAGDTSASTGKTLVYNARSGTDSFTGGFENDTVSVSAAAVGGDTLTGGSGTNTVLLTSAGTANLGGVSKFATINLAAGNSTVTVTDTTLSGGSVAINDGASGNNSVSAASDTSASTGKTLKYVTGSGTDTFTGGFENDTVRVSAAAVGGDTLTGGSGANTVLLTSAGAVNLGGVSKFAAIDLAAGNSTVTVTDKTLTGGLVTINDGASGNNSVSAASDTSASTGKTLKYVTGSGTDTFTGGFENDTVRVSAAAVGGDTLTGGSGANTVLLTSAGAVNLGGVSKFAAIDLAAGNSTVTVTDKTLTGGLVTINDGASGNNSVSAASDTSASTGKTLKYVTGSGTDTFTGGFENDTVRVSAVAVGGDTLTGGSGANTVVLTSAGAVNLGGVSKFSTIDLAAGNSTVMMTDKTLSGGSVAINDGASGNNTISAAGDTSASTGKTLRFFTGVGTDSFTGGFENDGIHVSAAAVGGDTLTGGSGSNSLTLSSAGAANLGGVSKFATINLAAGNSTVTVTDKTLSGGSVTIIDGASGNNSISAAGDTSASTGKTFIYYAGAGTDTFTGGFENDVVHVAATAVSGDTLTGGSGSNTVALTTAGAANLGGVSKFATINLAAGNSTVTVADKTLSGGSVTINAGASGNHNISAAGDTSPSTGKALIYYAGTGTDSFTGGFENDAVHVSAAAVGTDTLTGGSGTDTLVLTSAGTANLGGVSKFGTINLAAGNSTVTVTDATLSGGSVTINDGASGNNTISAAGDTSASTGKSLTYHAGSGTNGFTGGLENDTIYAGTGSGNYTAGSGTDSFVFIKSNLPSQTLNNFQVSTDDILVYGTHSAGGFDLGSTDNALNPTTPTAINVADFVSNASGDFTSSSQRFAYDTTNGNLFYSATGSNSSESLVAHLTGEPGFTASNLLFEH